LSEINGENKVERINGLLYCINLHPREIDHELDLPVGAHAKANHKIQTQRQTREQTDALICQNEHPEFKQNFCSCFLFNENKRRHGF